MGGIPNQIICFNSECIVNWRCQCDGNGCRSEGPVTILDGNFQVIEGASQMKRYLN